MRTLIRDILGRASLALVLFLPGLAVANQNDESPLRVIMAGRDEARRTMLTEEGAQALSISAANVIMYVSGAAGILVVVFGLIYLWQHNQEGDMSRRTGARGIGIILIGGLLTIPAIMAAIAPHALLGPAP